MGRFAAVVPFEREYNLNVPALNIAKWGFPATFVHAHCRTCSGLLLADSVAMNPPCWGLLIEVKAGVSVAMR
jgi:hypothetical protein